MKSDAFRVGERVLVHAVTSFDQLVVEGAATVVEACAEDDRYRVRFIDEKVTRLRFIPGPQHSPEQVFALARANALSDFAEFYPDLPKAEERYGRS